MTPARHQIVPARPEHVALLEKGLRAKDRAEITCAGLVARTMIWRSYRASVIARTGFVDGEIAAMWGVAGNLLGGEGEAWLLTSLAINRVPVTFVKEARRGVAEMLTLFPRLTGLVMESYTEAVGFLQVVGFTLGERVRIGDAVFRRVELVR